MKSKQTGLLMLSLFLAAGARALDKEKLIDHLRKTLNESTATQFIIGDPKPSDFKGLDAVPVSIRTDHGGQDTVIYYSEKKKKYILGNVIDMTVDPDKERAGHIKIDGAPFKGDKDAPVTVVEFSDLQCSYCRKAHNILDEQLFKEYSPKQVKIVFKHFPLGGHDWSRKAGQAAVCADQQGNQKFWEMTDKFFGQQEKINKGNVEAKAAAFATQIGLDKKKFDACMNDPRTDEKLQSDREEGLKAGVRSTPSFFINGRMIRGFRDMSSVKPVIDEKLGAAK